MFWKELRSLIPTMTEYRPRHGSNVRPLTVRLPILQEARTAFERVMGGPIDWPTLLAEERIKKLEFLVGLEIVFQRRSLERSVSAHQKLGEVEV